MATLPPDLFDTTTLISLASTVFLLATAYILSVRVLPASTTGPFRALFIWHAFDALIHFCLEGSFLYHCFFSYIPITDVFLRDLTDNKFYLTPGWLGHGAGSAGKIGSGFIYGAQAALAKIAQAGTGSSPTAGLWMVYARADRRWAGSDLSVVSLELLTVLVVAPLAGLVCYDIAKGNARANILMVVIATAELYGGFMTFCPEWLTGNQNLDGSNFMYLWVYLVFFNMIWVFMPFYALYVAGGEISSAFAVRDAALRNRKRKGL